jgi:hypothetical protein
MNLNCRSSLCESFWPRPSLLAALLAGLNWRKDTEAIGEPCLRLVHFDLALSYRFYHHQNLDRTEQPSENMTDTTAEAFKNWTSGLSSLGTLFALIIGGYWTYKHFIDFREGAPKIEFTVDVSFIHKQAGRWIVEVIALLDNKGRVAHRMEKLTFDLRYTLPDDPVENKDGFLVYVPHKECTGSWIPLDWKCTFIEPGVRTRYSSVASLPVKATTVLVHGKFLYPNDDFHTADKIVSVPQGASDAPTQGLSAKSSLDGKGLLRSNQGLDVREIS